MHDHHSPHVPTHARGCHTAAGSTCARRAAGRAAFLTRLAFGLSCSLALGMAQQGSAAAAGGAQSLAERLHAVQSGTPVAAQPVAPAAPRPKPFAVVAPGARSVVIPLVKDLIVVAARADPSGPDWEWIEVVLAIDAASVRDHLVAMAPPAAPSPPGAPAAPSASCDVVQDVADLIHAMSLFQSVCPEPVVRRPGMTQSVLSTAALNALRTGQPVPFHLPVGATDVLEKFRNGGRPYAPTQYAGGPQYACTLVRSGAADVAVPVLVNDQPADLAAIRVLVTCPDAIQSEDGGAWRYAAYVLDQPSYPLILAADSQDGSARHLQVVKIFFPAPSPGATESALEAALGQQEPVPVYGIYFDFNSDTIKPESEPVLAEIAAVLRKHPSWRLALGGHTDNIGSPPANLALSERRTAAVKSALVARYRIAPERLTVAGYGQSRPVAPNDTYEGRARNRRVELQRL